MTVYDWLAPGFDRQRPLPPGVPAEIRAAVLMELPPGPDIADIGCGAGRIGWPFVAAGDNYTAVDLSLGMLRQFAIRDLPNAPRLAQADATRLPFSDASFDGVLLVQVLSGAGHWRDLLNEVRRVLRPGGALFVGQSMAPDDGIDAQMKHRLAEILGEMNEHPYQPKSREDAFGWLARHASLTSEQVAQWPISRTPGQFIERHGTGARFSALPRAVRIAAMARLTEWASNTFGSLDRSVAEGQCFELRIYRFGQRTTA
jgi:ubiquinone/menaquinone biosynthesis C-methylase UbiE